MTGFFQSIVTIGLFILILGVLVVIHELGHFFTARAFRVRVLEFGIGFPPRAKVMRSKGETLYTLNWLPIGGFVKLEGEDGTDADDPRSFAAQRYLTKIVILVAGVAMNVVLAFAIFTGIALYGDPTVGIEVGGVQAGSPAETAGIVAGDTIVTIDGKTYVAFDRLSPLDGLRSNAGETVTLGIKSTDGTVEQVPVTLRPASQIDAQHGALGIERSKAAVLADPLHYSVGEAIQIGAQRTVDALGLIVGGLGTLAESIVNRPTEAPPVQGPVGIATQIGDIFWQLGPLFTLYVAGVLSANLAVVNILPFPPLDGGRMLMITLKRFLGARLSVRAEQLTYMVGFVFLFAFLIWITTASTSRAGWAGDPDPSMSSPDALRPRRRPTVSVDVGGVLVGSAHPGRRPVDDQHRHRRRRRDGDPGRAPGARRLAARARDGQHGRGGGGRPGDGPQGPRTGRGRPDHRRLPLQRPQAAGRVPGDGVVAREVPDQPGQRRREAPRRALRDDHQGRRSTTTSRSGSG